MEKLYTYENGENMLGQGNKESLFFTHIRVRVIQIMAMEEITSGLGSMSAMIIIMSIVAIGAIMAVRNKACEKQFLPGITIMNCISIVGSSSLPKY